ncbi:MAG: tetratricopeptide repeat protein, partial [Candidatus Angelobacter sp.]
FEGAVQVVDLTQATQGEAILDLRRIPTASSSLTPSRIAPESLPGQRPSANAEAQQAVKQGQNLLFRQHDLPGSIEQFKKAVKLDPWYGQGYMLLGLAQMESQDWGDAQYAFEEAAKVEPGNDRAFLGVGSALNQQGKYAEAEKVLEHSLELKPDSAEGHYELARSLASSGKWEAAEPHAQRASELNSEYAGPHALLGNIYLQQEDAASALAQFKEYLRLAPQGSLAPSVRETVTQLEAALAEAEKKGR